jgi:C4-dicarboxylate-binding protein DctP
MSMMSVPALTNPTLGLSKVTDTITNTAHAPVEFFLIINEKVWRSLSPSHRDIIAEAARSTEREARDRVAEFEAKALAFAGAKGIRIQHLTPDQVAEWRACSSEMLADYMDKKATSPTA